MVFSNFNENLSNEERASSLVSMPIRDYRYYAVNKGFNEYKVYKKEAIDITYDNVVDEEVILFDEIKSTRTHPEGVEPNNSNSDTGWGNEAPATNWRGCVC